MLNPPVLSLGLAYNPISFLENIMHPPSEIWLTIYLVGNCILILFNQNGLLDILGVHPGGSFISPLHQNLPVTLFGLALLVSFF